MKGEGISVIICCYNSVARLPETLKWLGSQEVCNNNNWEIIIIDNASTDDTTKVALTELHRYKHLEGLYRIEKELEPGLLAARRKGITIARYTHLLFCDDDNWLVPGFMEKAFELIKRYPEVDIFGSNGIGEYEVNPPAWFEAFKGCLAIGPQNKEEGFITKPIYGACMLMKKESYLELDKKGFRSLLSGRKGKKLSSGEDIEIGWWILLSGGKIYYSSALLFYHYMPAARLLPMYFVRLILKNVGHNNTLAIYPYIYMQREEKENLYYYYFFIKQLQVNFKRLIYCFPRIFIGKYKFYNLLGFLHHIKLLSVLVAKNSLYKKQFNDIKSLNP
jgi:glycosyltransferase involved in cell wall biosynthesis